MFKIINEDTINSLNVAAVPLLLTLNTFSIIFSTLYTVINCSKDYKFLCGYNHSYLNPICHGVFLSDHAPGWGDAHSGRPA